jgi:hypothetical protein
MMFKYSCHSDDAGATFLRKIGFFKSHTAQHPREQHSSFLQYIGKIFQIEFNMSNLLLVMKSQS